MAARNGRKRTTLQTRLTPGPGHRNYEMQHNIAMHIFQRQCWGCRCYYHLITICLFHVESIKWKYSLILMNFTVPHAKFCEIHSEPRLCAVTHRYCTVHTPSAYLTGIVLPVTLGTSEVLETKLKGMLLVRRKWLCPLLKTAMAL